MKFWGLSEFGYALLIFTEILSIDLCFIRRFSLQRSKWVSVWCTSFMPCWWINVQSMRCQCSLVCLFFLLLISTFLVDTFFHTEFSDEFRFNRWYVSVWSVPFFINKTFLVEYIFSTKFSGEVTIPYYTPYNSETLYSLTINSPKMMNLSVARNLSLPGRYGDVSK